MANFNHPMSFENPYTFVDPFQVSINFSLQNLITRRRDQELTIDDIPLPPPNFLSQPYGIHVPTPDPSNSTREPSPSYYSLSPSRISSKHSRSPPASCSRNTFGMEGTKDRSEPRIPSPKPSGSRSSFLAPRSDREVLPDNAASGKGQLHQAASIGSPHPFSPTSESGSDRSRTSHRRRNLPPDRQSRAEAKNSRPEIILEHRHSVGHSSTNAISFYKPPTRSSEVALPSSSPYPTSFFAPSVHDSNRAIKHENSIPPASQPPLAQTLHQSPPLTIYILAFLLDTLPRQIYLNLMLRLPHLYFTHVVHIFEDAEMSMPEIKKMALEANNYLKDPTISKPLHLESGFGSPRYENLSKSWGAFIDSLTREWKTMNIISVLLLSAILTILQIPSAANDPVTRYATFLSMMCAVMSLLYGSIYVIRFSMMRATCKAAEWAHEAQKTRTGIFWNVWVLLAMPATWLAWSLIFFLISVMAFIWRTGTIEDATQTTITTHEALAPRIIVTLVFSLGLVYLILIRNTFRRYGTAMDRAWRTRVLVWMQQNYHYNNFIPIDPTTCSLRQFISSPVSPSMTSPRSNLGNGSSTPPPPVAVSEAFLSKDRPRGRPTSIKPISTFVEADNPHRPSPASGRSVIKQTRILGLSADDPSANVVPSKEVLISYQMTKDDWDQLSSEIRASWDPDHSSIVQSILQRWNQSFFSERGAQIALCEEFGVPGLKYAIYHFPWKDELPTGKDSYDPIPQNLTRLDIYSLPSGAAGLSLI